MDQDPVADARALVDELFPEAVWALVTGSVLTAARTAGSDLDIVVMLPPDHDDAPYRNSLHFRGWPVEMFVHDDQSLAHYLAKERAARKPSLHRMIARGVAVCGDPSPWRDSCAAALENGPPALTVAELDAARYGLTDLIDDLLHAVDAGERSLLATATWIEAAHEALAFAGHWNGTGKWLLRELRLLDPDLAGRWLAAHGDAEAIAAFAREVLDQAGGPLFDGYRAAGERPVRG